MVKFSELVIIPKFPQETVVGLQIIFRKFFENIQNLEFGVGYALCK